MNKEQYTVEQTRNIVETKQNEYTVATKNPIKNPITASQISPSDCTSHHHVYIYGGKGVPAYHSAQLRQGEWSDCEENVNLPYNVLLMANISSIWSDSSYFVSASRPNPHYSVSPFSSPSDPAVSCWASPCPSCSNDDPTLLSVSQVQSILSFPVSRACSTLSLLSYHLHVILSHPFCIQTHSLLSLPSLSPIQGFAQHLLKCG